LEQPVFVMLYKEGISRRLAANGYMCYK